MVDNELIIVDVDIGRSVYIQNLSRLLVPSLASPRIEGILVPTF